MEFINSSFIPNKCVGGVIADYRLDKASKMTLEQFGIKVIPSVKVSVQEAVCGHSDMMIHHIQNNKFAVSSDAYEHFKRHLPDAEFIIGSKPLKPDYPYDILYNAASFGNFVICNAAYTAIEILSEYRRSSKKILNVKQGYSKCSICIVNENAIITADKGIAKICRENKIDVLEIKSGYIELKGMDYGFFGGATGLISKNKLAVNGELKTHPNGENIKSFCNYYNVEIIELKKGIITDIGSIMPIF